MHITITSWLNDDRPICQGLLCGHTPSDAHLVTQYNPPTRKRNFTLDLRRHEPQDAPDPSLRRLLSVLAARRLTLRTGRSLLPDYDCGEDLLHQQVNCPLLQLEHGPRRTIPNNQIRFVSYWVLVSVSHAPAAVRRDILGGDPSS